MKKVSDFYKEQGIDFKFPIIIKDANGNRSYFEDSTGYWRRSGYDADGRRTYFEDSNGSWDKEEYDADGNRTYSEGENSNGHFQKKRYNENGELIGKLEGWGNIL